MCRWKLTPLPSCRSAIALILLAVLCCPPGAWGQSAAEYNKLGIDAYDADRFNDAIGYFEKAYEKARDNETVRRNLCNARQARANELAKADDFDGAIRELEVAVSVDASNPSPLVQLGSYYLHKGLTRDAILRLEEAIDVKPGYLDAHEFLGRAYYADNDLASARAQWEYVLELDPTRKDLRERYEKALREESVESDFSRGQSRHFRLSYPKEMNYQMRSSMLTMLERIYMEVCRKFEGAYPPGPIEVIVYGADEFTEATQLGDYVGAVYDGKVRAPLTDAEGVPLEQNELRRRLTHEFVHVVVRYLVQDKAPWWLNEGLAETLSKSPEEINTGLLRRALEHGQAFNLSELEAAQLQKLDGDALRLAYAQSHATVRYLWSRHGAHRVRQLVTEVAATGSAEQALVRLFRLDYEQLTNRVFERLR